MRYVVARRSSRIGEGLGYEILPWAKGGLASEVLGARLVGPSWTLNRRKYYRNFRTSRFDVLFEELLVRLPHHDFTYEDYQATGEVAFDRAIHKWASSKNLLNRRHFIVSVSGPWGGFASLRNARPFIMEKLLHSREAVHRVYEMMSGLNREKLFVAVHMRFGGDFRPQTDVQSLRGEYNLLIPGAWYLAACEAIRAEFGDRVEFRFFTDKGGPEFEEAIRRFNPGQKRQPGLTECSDLYVMTQADLRVCSISAYSLASNFLSETPYLWHEPQLTLNGELYTLWGNDEDQRKPGSLTHQSASVVEPLKPGSPWENEFRGYAFAIGDRLPTGLIAQLERKIISKSRPVNLIEYGCLPTWTRSPQT